MKTLIGAVTELTLLVNPVLIAWDGNVSLVGKKGVVKKINVLPPIKKQVLAGIRTSFRKSMAEYLQPYCTPWKMLAVSKYDEFKETLAIYEKKITEFGESLATEAVYAEMEKIVTAKKGNWHVYDFPARSQVKFTYNVACWNESLNIPTVAELMEKAKKGK